MKRALILTPLFATLLLAAPAMAADATLAAPDENAAPPRQTKGIALPPTDPQTPAEPAEPVAPVEEGTAPEEAKGGDALMHVRKAYD